MNMCHIKIKKAFILRRVCGNYIIMPAGENVKDFHWFLLLNETSAFIYEQLRQGKSIKETADALVSEYDVTMTQAQECVKRIIESLKEAGVADEK